MKKLLQSYLIKYRSLPMQKKMIYSYSIPVITICIVVNVVCFSIFSNRYVSQLKYSINQSSSQTENFITNYIENMYYISQLIADNATIKDIFHSADKNKERAIDNQYREYWKLYNVLANIELSNATYKIGLYVPDSFIYSNNNYYFYPESSLKQREDYENIMESIKQDKLYFALIDEVPSFNPNMVETYIALFQKINIETENGSTTYVSKVEIPINELKIVLDKTRSTKNNLVYLVDESGNLLLASNQNYFEELKKSNTLPTQKVDSWSLLKLGEKEYYVVYQQIKGYNWKLFSLIPKEEFQGQSSFIWFMVFLTIILLSIAVSLVSYRLSRHYTKRLSDLNQNIKNLKSGELNTTLRSKTTQSLDEIDEIYLSFNYMTDELRRLMKEHYRLGKNVMSAELRALQAQINPHFLYNTLDIINWGAIDYGATQVAEIARNLGQFYRLSLNHGKSAIAIKDELKHVEAFVNIENAHFDDAIHLSIEVGEEIMQYACLNIILQPFVENAIVHGIAKYSEITECNIDITAKLESHDIIFCIKDDGRGIKEEQLSSILSDSESDLNNGYGIKNINFRIKLCYGDKYGISYKSNLGFGTEVFIRIPAMTLEQLYKILK